MKPVPDPTSGVTEPAAIAGEARRHTSGLLSCIRLLGRWDASLLAASAGVYLFKRYVSRASGLEACTECTAHLLYSSLLELAPLFAFAFVLVRIRRGPLALLLRGMAILYAANLVTNIAYFLVAHEYVSAELLRNINIYSLRGQVSAPLVPLAILAAGASLFGLWRLLGKLSDFRTSTLWAACYLLALAAAWLAVEDTRATDAELGHSLNGIELLLHRGGAASKERLLETSYGASAKLALSVGTTPAGKLAAREPLGADELKFLADNRVGIPIGRNRPSKVPQKIVLIAIESLPLAYYSKYNPRVPAEVTPYLNSMVERSGTFEHFFTSGIPTDHGLTAMLCSFPVMDTSLADTLDCMPRALKRLLFRSSLFRSVSLRYNDHYTSYKEVFGFTRMFGWDDYPEPRIGWGWGATDAFVFSQALAAILSSGQQREFVVISTIDTHPPYFAGDSSLSSPSRLLRTLNNLDKNIEHFVEALRKSPMWDETLIILTSDHSPNHGDYLEWAGVSDFVPARIPLTFLGGAEVVRELQTIDKTRLYSQLDFLPTIAEALGLELAGPRAGSSMFAGSDHDARTFVPSVSGDAIRLHSKTHTVATGIRWGQLDKPGRSVAENAIRKHLVNNFLAR